MTKRIHESGTITVDPATKKFRVRLINEGKGSSADYPREFFTAENAAALAGALSFPGHPIDLERPEHRDPLTAIGYIGDQVDIEIDAEGKAGFWADYYPAQSRPDVTAYLVEFADKLGLSVYADSDGHSDPVSGKWIAESISADDPYRSVDLVIAPGRGGKFERVAEGLRRITEASATAGGEEENKMEIKELAEKVDKLTTIVESLTNALNQKAVEAAQVKADDAAVEKAVESRLSDYDKAVSLISEAKLTESQAESLRALAKSGTDIAPHIESAKKVLAEAKALAGSGGGQIAEAHLGGGNVTDITFDVPGFGKVS